MASTSREQALASLKQLLVSGAYSDLTITCGSDTYKVHKNIVCERADFFARAVKFGGEEAQTGVIDLPEDEPEVIKLLVQYLYEGEYDPALPLEGEKSTSTQRFTAKTSNSPLLRLSIQCFSNCKNFTCLECTVKPLPALNGEPKQLLIHAKMYEVGEKYDVVGLKDLAREKFSRSCKHFWDDPIFAVAANHAFSTTIEEDTGLRNLVSSTIAEHMELVEKPEIAQLMAQFNGLAMSILQAGIKEQRWGKKK